MSHAVLQRLLAERTACLDFVTRTCDQAEAAQRDLSDTEQETLTKQRDRVKQLDPQIAQLEEFEKLRAADQRSAETYRPTAGGQQSTGQTGQRQSAVYTEPRATEYRTAGELMADAWKAENSQGETREAASQRLAGAGLELRNGAVVKRAAPNVLTSDTPGILPTPIVGDIIRNIDAARPFIASIGPKDLGGIPGTAFNRPIVTTSTSVAEQTTQNTTVQSGTFVIGSVPFTKKTYGGYVTVSRQDVDWTAPGVWDALLQDFQEIYGLQTEDAAADAFAAAVTQVTDYDITTPAAPAVADLLQALYNGAALAYAGAGQLPDTIWQSLDQWSYWGPKIDQLKATANGTGGGDSHLSSFAGYLLEVPRVIVPKFPNNTTIIGVKSKTEVYEDRFGFLSAVQPKVFGVDLAYGGYMASGTLKPAAFCKITFI